MSSAAASTSPANRSAAFFDLDRTLLSGASGRTYGDALRRVGLGPRRTPVENLIFDVFDRFGETLPAMLLTRQGIRAVRGWDRDRFREAGAWAAPHLAQSVQPWAPRLFDEHRAAGRRLVMATTTPVDLVEPLAEALGFDAVIATRYEAVDGRFTGNVDGPFVWGTGKRDAVRAWAAAEGVDLEASFAYSDSFYDQFLFGAVGHPVAVNPDPKLMVLAGLRRWPVLNLDAPPGVPRLLGVEPQQMLYLLARPEVLPFARFDLAGIDLLPDDGPAIIVGNHRSYFDPLAIGYLLAQRGRPVRFLGKREVFDAPLVGDVVTALGGIPVDRGSGSDEPLAAAEAALEAGELVALMPQGTIPRGEAFFDPELKGRWGAARLAERTRAPVIPVGLWGTEQVWPRSSRVPYVWNLLTPPRVRITAGAPVELAYESLEDDTEAIMSALVDLLPPEAREQRTPSPEELARTFPAGHDGTDAEHERSRRPGID